MVEWKQCQHLDGTPAMDQGAVLNGWTLNVNPRPDGRWDWYADHGMNAHRRGTAASEEAAKKAAEDATKPVIPPDPSVMGWTDL